MKLAFNGWFVDWMWAGSYVVQNQWVGAGLILGLRPSSERRRYKVTASLLAERRPRIRPLLCRTSNKSEIWSDFAWRMVRYFHLWYQKYLIDCIGWRNPTNWQNDHHIIGKYTMWEFLYHVGHFFVASLNILNNWYYHLFTYLLIAEYKLPKRLLINAINIPIAGCPKYWNGS